MDVNNNNQQPENLNLDPEVVYLGTTNGDKPKKTFGIYSQDRRKHLYILGKTGMGKTTLLQNMVLQDIYNGYGVCFLDPHGDSCEYILNRIPKHRQSDVVYLNPADIEHPVALNILQSKSGEEPYLMASELMAVFNRIWAGTWSARMEYILNNTLLALLEKPGNTILGVIKMLTDDHWREQIVSKLQDPLVKNFWQKEFANFNSRYRQEAISPILNKVGQFLSSELMRNILGQTESTIDIRQIMDEGKILIVNLSKGRLGEDNSNLFGSLLVAKLQIAAMSRVNLPEADRKDFFVYVDEFQNFTTDSFASILSEARKYRLNLILAHQYISQLTESGNSKVKNAIFGNVGSIITFRLGSQDAEEISREFKPNFFAKDLVSLNPTQIVVKLSQKGRVIDAFLGNTMPPIFTKLSGSFDFIVEFSRHKYAKKRAVVRDIISAWFEQDEALKQLPKNQNYSKKDFKNKKKEQNPTPQNLPKKSEKPRNESILSLTSPKKRTNNMSFSAEIKFSKEIHNLNLKSDKIDDFKQDLEDKDYPRFQIPGK
jgi:DNA segregation ATPase FtsK/SpoIIIE-like protein